MNLLDAHEFSARALPYVQRQVNKYRSKFSKKTYNQHQYAVLNLLRLWWDCTYRDVYKRVRQMSGVKRVLELNTVPHWTRIQKAFAKQPTFLYRRILKDVLDDCETGRIGAVDASGFSRGRVSHHYTKRTGIHIQSLKTTILVDCEKGWILDVHLTTTRKHDSQIGPILLRDLPESLEIMTGDKGYDDAQFRKELRERGMVDQIKYREFKEDQAHANAYLDERDYSKRSFVETVMFVLKARFGEAVRSRVWHRQFKEMVARSLVYNLDRAFRVLRLFRFIPKMKTAFI